MTVFSVKTTRKLLITPFKVSKEYTLDQNNFWSIDLEAYFVCAAFVFGLLQARAHSNSLNKT